MAKRHNTRNGLMTFGVDSHGKIRNAGRVKGTQIAIKIFTALGSDRITLALPTLFATHSCPDFPPPCLPNIRPCLFPSKLPLPSHPLLLLSSMSPFLHPASLVDASLHSAATLQLVDLALTDCLIGKCPPPKKNSHPFVSLTFVRFIRLCCSVYRRSGRLRTRSRLFLLKRLKSQRRLPPRRVHRVRIQRALSVRG